MGLLTSREELGVNYEPLSPVLKQLQPKPESPHRREEMERVQTERERERGRDKQEQRRE